MYSSWHCTSNNQIPREKSRWGLSFVSELVNIDCNLLEPGFWRAQPRTRRASAADLVVLMEQEDVYQQCSQTKPAYLSSTTTLSFSNRTRVRTEKREVSIRVGKKKVYLQLKEHNILVHTITDKFSNCRAGNQKLQ